MTSTPSKTGTAPRGGFQFPPRKALPDGIRIRRVRLLGTSWYERGFLYWARRVGIAAMLALIVVVYVAMIEGVLQAVSRPGTSTYWALVAVEIVFTVVSGIFMFRHLWRNGVTGRSAGEGPPRAGRAGAGLGALAFSVGGAFAGLIALCSVISAGVVLAAFAMWLAPVPPTEQYARRMLAEKLQSRHDHQQFLHQYSHGRRRRKR